MNQLDKSFNFKKKSLDAICKSEKGKRLYVYDTKVRGLELMVTEERAKSFKVYRKLNNMPIRVTLGKYPEISIDQARSKMAPKKIYCIDHAFVTSVSPRILVNWGHLLENLVFLALRRVSPLIYYYKTKTGREVDFIVQNSNHQKTLVQVCESMANEQTKKREVLALTDAMTELGLDSSIIVTRHEEEQLHINGKRINIIPIWRFLLEQST